MIANSSIVNLKKDTTKCYNYCQGYEQNPTMYHSLVEGECYIYVYMRACIGWVYEKNM